MEKFEFNKPSLVKNFLTSKAFTILRAIEITPNSFSQEIMKKIVESGIKLKKSQFYRYIDTLEKYNLINIEGWIKDKESSGYFYKISEGGKYLLNALSKIFES